MLNTETAAGTRGKSAKARAEELVHDLLAEHGGDVNEAMEAFSERAQADLALALAVVGEAGPLHVYANPAKLWKRLGLAVIGGERQRRYSDPELAALHGYNPRRRSVSWVAFDSLLKSQGADGPYRKYYDDAKSRYLERGWTKMHSHRAAARYSEKKLLKHLWRAWQHELRGQTTFDTQRADAPQTLPHLKDAA